MFGDNDGYPAPAPVSARKLRLIKKQIKTLSKSMQMVRERWLVDIYSSTVRVSRIPKDRK